jgi:hypothetical protein
LYENYLNESTFGGKEGRKNRDKKERDSERNKLGIVHTAKQ